jgi:hypothetical protein
VKIFLIISIIFNRCGYCGEEIFTRYAATYHIKYKHTGMPRNFIQNKADITQYYVNRAKKEEEKNQFKVVDTRRVRVPTRNGKSVHHQQNKSEITIERPVQQPPLPLSPSPPPLPPLIQLTKSPLSTPPPSNISQTPATPDYRFLLAWSYYLATQAAWLSPALQQQQGQSPLSLPTDPEEARKFIQAMQSVMHPLTTTANNSVEQNELEVETINTSVVVKEEVHES